MTSSPSRVRETEVEQEQIRPSDINLRDTIPGGHGLEESVVLGRQRGAKESTDRGIVFDY
jgi:hypothetical protein